MRRFRNRLLKICLIILLFLVGLGIAFALFVDANHLKPFLIKKVYQWTGRELVIDGPLAWSFFPTLGVTSGHIGLKNIPGADSLYLLEADKMRLSVRLMPLLQGRIEAGSVMVNNAAWRWEDPLSKKTLLINHLKMTASNASLNEAFPLQLTFDVQLNNPALTGKITLNGQARIHQDTKQFTLSDFKLKSHLNINKLHLNTQLNGLLSGDLDQWVVDWQSLSGMLANLPLKGHLHWARFPNTATTGDLTLSSFNLKSFFHQIGFQDDFLQQADKVSGQLSLLISTDKNIITGTFKAPNIKMANLKLENVVLPFHFKNGELDVQNATFNFYNGRASLKNIAKFQMLPWQFATQLGLNQVQLEPLLKELNPKAKLSLSGAGNLALLLTSSGQTLPQILQQLNGSARFNIHEGALRGIDIDYLLDSAMALAGKKTTPTMRGFTPFSSLSGTALIRNGLVSNTDLMLLSSKFTMAGKGTINLPTTKINYGLQARLNKIDPTLSDDVSNLYGLPVPVIVSGSFEAPKVRLDSAVLLQALAKQQLKKSGKRLLERELGDKIAGPAGLVLDQLLGQ